METREQFASTNQVAGIERAISAGRTRSLSDPSDISPCLE
jgi:hypothetical protein